MIICMKLFQSYCHVILKIFTFDFLDDFFLSGEESLELSSELDLKSHQKSYITTQPRQELLPNFKETSLKADQERNNKYKLLSVLFKDCNFMLSTINLSRSTQTAPRLNAV